MDAAAVETNAFLIWFQTYGQIAYIVIQVLYWIVVAWAAVFASVQAKRLVDFKLGKTAKATESEAEPVSVEEFVD